jgi:hypothetical protein
MALRIIVRGLDIDRLRRMPSAITPPTKQVPVPILIHLPCPCPEQTDPSFCRYMRCKHPDICKNAGICNVDWEPELIKE